MFYIIYIFSTMKLQKEFLQVCQREYSAAALDSTRELVCFLSTKSCKPIIEVTQIKIMNLKMRLICFL